MPKFSEDLEHLDCAVTRGWNDTTCTHDCEAADVAAVEELIRDFCFDDEQKISIVWGATEVPCLSGKEHCPSGSALPVPCAEGATCTIPASPELIIEYNALLERRESEVITSTIEDEVVGEITYTLSLSVKPDRTVNVTVTKQAELTADCSSRPDGLLLDTVTHVFEPSNWNVSQAVRIDLRRDLSTFQGTSTARSPCRRHPPLSSFFATLSSFPTFLSPSFLPSFFHSFVLRDTSCLSFLPFPLLPSVLPSFLLRDTSFLSFLPFFLQRGYFISFSPSSFLRSFLPSSFRFFSLFPSRSFLPFCATLLSRKIQPRGHLERCHLELGILEAHDSDHRRRR
jgi:hypothetical protein